ncbi:MAG: hypothetical protein HQL51_04860 [Magnetococcales bacterium]|nr:hypothetical protein [Magnetococcales bacterium]
MPLSRFMIRSRRTGGRQRLPSPASGMGLLVAVCLGLGGSVAGSAEGYQQRGYSPTPMGNVTTQGDRFPASSSDPYRGGRWSGQDYENRGAGEGEGSGSGRPPSSEGGAYGGYPGSSERGGGYSGGGYDRSPGGYSGGGYDRSPGGYSGGGYDRSPGGYSGGYSGGGSSGGGTSSGYSGGASPLGRRSWGENERPWGEVPPNDRDGRDSAAPYSGSGVPPYGEGREGFATSPYRGEDRDPRRDGGGGSYADPRTDPRGRGGYGEFREGGGQGYSSDPYRPGNGYADPLYDREYGRGGGPPREYRGENGAPPYSAYDEWDYGRGYGPGGEDRGYSRRPNDPWGLPDDMMPGYMDWWRNRRGGDSRFW